jgi:hypothetical protein
MGKWMPVLLILTKPYLTGKFPAKVCPMTLEAPVGTIEMPKWWNLVDTLS